MANGRFVSRTIATDKRLSQLSLESEYLFLKTLPHLDRDGLILADVLWSTVAPRRLTLAATACDLWQEWVDRGLAVAYETDEGTVLYMPGFAKNQQGMRYDREAPSRYAPPPGFSRTVTGMTPDLLPTNSGPTPPQVKGQEEVKGQVKEQQQQQGQRETPAAEQAPTPTPIVIAFLEAGILETSHDDILKANQEVTPADVGAWVGYCNEVNTRRNGNKLEPGFIVDELKAKHRAPEKYYVKASADEYQPFVLE